MNKIQRLARRIVHRTQHPLVLHLRRHRFCHGDRKLGQAELAALAGISARQLRQYETSTQLPRAVANLLAVAVALDVRVEDIIAHRALHAIQERVRERRKIMKIKRCRARL